MTKTAIGIAGMLTTRRGMKVILGIGMTMMI